VNGPAARAREQAIDNVARARVASDPLIGPVLWRVVSMVLARADWPVDRLDEALLVCDALCAHAPAYARQGGLTFTVEADEHEAELRVRELTAGGAAALLRGAILPIVGNVLERVSERVLIEPEEHGGGSQLVLTLNSC
jgi:serine/threonine-protein kinase RsbW